MRRVGVLLLILLCVGGCGGQPGNAAATPTQSESHAPQPSATASTSTVGGTVIAYYTAVGAHDTTSARALLAPEYFKGFASQTAYQAWVANYLRLTNVAVASERSVATDTAAQHPGFSDFHEVLVSYDAVLRTPSANETTGREDRFVLVARSDSTSSWLIVNITTGP